MFYKNIMNYLNPLGMRQLDFGMKEQNLHLEKLQSQIFQLLTNLHYHKLNK